jgi:hypothetical protein
MGDEATGLMGVWLLRSAYLERVDDGEKIFQYGDAPFPLVRTLDIVTPCPLAKSGTRPFARTVRLH